MTDTVNYLPWMHRQRTLLGHQNLMDNFGQQFQKGRLHHAWLLTGPKGIGKATLAHHLARHLLRDGGDLNEIEPEDKTYFSCISGGHPDLMIIHKDREPTTKKTISIDQVRQVSQFVNQTSAQNGWRVVIIDAVDDLNEKAANALLKNLEEPGTRTLFFLVCHNQHGVLPTIKSRCQQAILKPLPDDALATYMQDHYPDLTPAHQHFYTTVSEGRFGVLSDLITHDGYKICHGFLTAILEAHQNPQQIPWSQLKFTEAYGTAKAAGEYTTFEYLYLWWLGRHVRAVSLQTPAGLQGLPAQTQDIYNLSTFGPAYWTHKYEEFMQASAIDKTFNLDHRLMVMSALG